MITDKQIKELAEELNNIAEATEKNSPAYMDPYTGLSLIDVINLLGASNGRTNEILLRIAVALEKIANK